LVSLAILDRKETDLKLIQNAKGCRSPKEPSRELTDLANRATKGPDQLREALEMIGRSLNRKVIADRKSRNGHGGIAGSEHIRSVFN
jgi:hypothetical protein